MWNIVYEHDGVIKFYCVEWGDLQTMIEIKKKFLERYGDGKDDIRPYPNGRGFYSFINLRLVFNNAMIRRGK